MGLLGKYYHVQRQTQKPVLAFNAVLKNATSACLAN